MNEQKFINLLAGMKGKITESEMRALINFWNHFEKVIADMQLQRDHAAYKAVQYKEIADAQESVYEDHLRRLILFFRQYEKSGNQAALDCLRSELTAIRVYRKIEFELMRPLLTDTYKFLN